MPIIEHVTRRRPIALGVAALGVAGAVVGTLVVGTGERSNALPRPDPPVGQPLLPDIVPAIPTDLRIENDQDRSFIAFSSILVNIGEGDFILRATRESEDAPWLVEQDVPYSTSGAQVVPLETPLVWGGDGHEHWHIKRVAINRLVPLDGTGRPDPDAAGWPDAKVGFCFYDFSRQLDSAPQNAVYSSKSCGDFGDDEVGMGLSIGWGDTYNYGLPGQRIEVTELPDGAYRLWVEADKRGWFREATRDNNVTWANIALSTKPNGLRDAKITRLGPLIRPEG